MNRKEAHHASVGKLDKQWSVSVEKALHTCLRRPEKELKHEDLCELVERIIERDFYYAREVSGVHLTQRGHKLMEPDAKVGIDYYPKCDFLLRPKERLIKMGFPDMFVCFEVKVFRRKPRGYFNPGVFNASIKQCMDYNASAFFLSTKHADREGNVLVPGTAIRPAYSFVFYNGRYFGQEGEWPFDVAAESHVGLLHLVRSKECIGWRFDQNPSGPLAFGRVDDGIFYFQTQDSVGKNRIVASGTRPLLPPVGDLLKQKIPRKEKWTGKPSGRLKK